MPNMDHAPLQFNNQSASSSTFANLFPSSSSLLPFPPFPIAPPYPFAVQLAWPTVSSTATVPSSLSNHQITAEPIPSTSQRASAPPAEMPFVDRIGESARNRFGRPYISGRPLLLCDRQKIIQMHQEGRRKIAIAREIGVTHSCVSKVIRRFEENGGMLDSKQSRTASCACPGDADGHDLRVCRHAKFHQLTAKQQMATNAVEVVPIQQHLKQLPKKFSIEWILSEHCPKEK